MSEERRIRGEEVRRSGNLQGEERKKRTEQF